MEEFRHSLRLMRRIALFTAVHGVSVVASMSELSADSPAFTHSEQSILDRSMSQRRPTKLPEVTPGNVETSIRQRASTLDFAPVNASDSARLTFPLLSAPVTDRQKILQIEAFLRSAPDANWMPPSIRRSAPVTTDPASLEDHYIESRSSAERVFGSTKQIASELALTTPASKAAAVLSAPQHNHLLPSRLPAVPIATVPSQPAYTAVDAMLQSTPIWIEPHLDEVELITASTAATSPATVHESKLRELAFVSLRDAHSRLQRGATHSAQKIATESLSLIVAMADAREGGNTHERQLQSALVAIRESKEFWGPRGPIDHATLARSIAVHETTVLKGKQLDDVSTLQATELYLAFAKDQLGLATGSVREASDALVLLGQIETRMSATTDPHAAAVALTMHRAAVQIDPANGFCRRELGRMLLRQGLATEAIAELRQSTFLQPTRSGYEALREAASRAGDVELARHCVDVLNDSGLPTDVPIYRLPPDQFAATHRPNAVEMNHSLNAQGDKPESDREAPKVTEKRSWFPFGRH